MSPLVRSVASLLAAGCRSSTATPAVVFGRFAPTVEAKTAAPGPAPDGMVWIPDPSEPKVQEQSR